MLKAFSVSLVVVGLALVSGCSGTTITAPPVAKVSGTVNLDGKPMPEGTIRFEVMGFPPKTSTIKDGAFTGEAYSGKNRVDVVLEHDGPPSTTDPKVNIKINVVAPKELSADVTAGGANTFTFDVNSVR